MFVYNDLDLYGLQLNIARSSDFGTNWEETAADLSQWIPFLLLLEDYKEDFSSVEEPISDL